MSDLIYTEPKYTECADTAVVTRGSADDPWGGWERWLDGHLAIERHAIVETIVETLSEVEAKYRPRRGPHASRLRHGACRARERNERSNLIQLISTRRGPWAE